MKEKLEEIKTKGLEKIKNVKTIAELEEVRKELTGKKSELSEVLKSMKDLSVEEKKTIGMIAAVVIVLGLSLVVYNQMIPNEYAPADDEIALHIRLDAEEDIGLLVFDYRADSHEYSGGISNADGSLISRDSDNIVVWNQEELHNPSEPFELSMQFRIITEYVAPNYENVYPDDITKCMEPVSWEAHFGESYFITITGDQTNGYKAVLNKPIYPDMAEAAS